MIECIRKGICSWNYHLRGSGHSATVEFDWISERGSLVIDGESYNVRKHGLLSGKWTLDVNSTPILTAEKSSVFTRSFELATSSGEVTLRAQSPFGRTILLKSAEFDAVIAPVHPFTRRATITGQIADFRVAWFAFWLTVLLWRRAAKNN